MTHDAARAPDQKHKWLGLALVILFCATILATAFACSERYYAKNMVLTDTSYFLMSVGILLQGRDDFDAAHVLRSPTPLHSSDYGTDVYVLHNLTAWLLKALLPVRPSLAVVLNGSWFIAMAISFYLLLWDRTQSWPVSMLATASFLIGNPYVPTVQFGLTSLDPNLHAFMLGTSALCWVLLSRSFRDRKASLLAGLFLGLLIMARVYSLGVVVPALLPFAIMGLRSRERSEIKASLIGGTIAISAALAVSGWWLFPRLAMLRAYTTQFNAAGVLGRTGLAASAVAWLRFTGELLAANAPVACVLTWIFAARFLSGERGLLRQLNVSLLWIAVAPLLILAWLGTTFGPYGALSLLGIYLALLFPFRPGENSVMQRREFVWALALTTALGTVGFFSTLASAHAVDTYDKSSLTTAIAAIRTDASLKHRRRVSVGLVHWGILHEASLLDAMIFDAGIRVATPEYPPKPHANQALVVDPKVIDLWVWDRRLHGSQAMTPERWTAELTRSADYVIVLAGDPTQRRRGGRWKPWVQASRILRESPAFAVLAGPLVIPSDGKVLVLARR